MYHTKFFNLVLGFIFLFVSFETSSFSLTHTENYLKKEKFLLNAANNTSRTLIPKITNYLKDPDPDIRIFSAIAIGEIGNSKSTKALIPSLRDKNKFVRVFTLRALGLIGDQSSREQVKKHTTDSDELVKISAMSALLFIDLSHSGPLPLKISSFSRGMDLLKQQKPEEALLEFKKEEHKLLKELIQIPKEISSKGSARQFLELYIKQFFKRISNNDYQKKAHVLIGSINNMNTLRTLGKLKKQIHDTHDRIIMIHHVQNRAVAINSLSKHINIAKKNPKNAFVYYRLGQIYFWISKYNEAADALKVAVRLDPQNPGTHSILAKSYIELKEFDKAKIYVKKAVELKADMKKEIKILEKQGIWK